ncbi:hypothetical protein ACGF0J_10220 [Nonomuraea sp. NPDC047897]|uniref:hypothetical protein n=1 Tax=Nonomuraea sp. NPDC047897 TaxID=3364346 RepID=UPI00371BE735
MVAADPSDPSPRALRPGRMDPLEDALETLNRAYTEAVAAITSVADPQAAFAGAARVGEVLRELDEDLAARRARLSAEIRMGLIQSAVR